VSVPAPSSGVPDAVVSGELCVPAGGRAGTVQLLVPAFTYARAFWDIGVAPERYSFVRRALAVGDATFAVDRLGTGRSTHPPSSSMTLEADAGSLYDVVRALHTDAVGGRAFSRVVYVGQSLGAINAWLIAAQHPGAGGVDAFVLISELHLPTKPSFAAHAIPDLVPAATQSRFAGLGLDPGYATTVPGVRGDLFYFEPNADPRVIAADEASKDVGALPEFGEALAPVPAPDDAPSRAISAPTLVVTGTDDGIVCGPPDGFPCTAADVRAHEAPYYSPGARLTTLVVGDAGHNITLQKNAPVTDALIQAWIAIALLGRH